ncbi:MAG: hypothetical protein GWN99_16495 [Gemmatimonadetes bacterium]|uniref:Porin n=1 Tax=Candidatus Kutchimonas denitrificans TaxID=3056748 RepID=A0AAE4Z6R6_9BACT|nr:hypothetical protein [Gemmatimonadota bacterium]NIR74389.1 hypothetical protein [Candidatus Kutchimonas denitrificans]NIS02640.1 hypothetical protein [Gemmatimonadota bacterium]NIT68515.1 hypothetical protein [Gemmatimonadota bacterium]NIU51992.1 hypothetical protein [Gemmatimonadota bacterium]
MNRFGICGRALPSLLLAVLLTATAAVAQERDMEERLRELERQVELIRQQLEGQDSAAIARLRMQIEAITREIEELKLGQEVVVPADSGLYGLGPAASRVYRAGQGVSIGGYGELLYENFASEREDGSTSGATDQLDALRAVFYVGYKFGGDFLFNSEIELEHASTGGDGSVSVEFAYIDWLFSEPLGARAGLLLVPMGLLNELHEPPIFLGSERPLTERAIIPSTWRENGVGLFGGAEGFSYRAYLVNGLDATGFSAAGLRGGRQKGSKALAEDFAAVARVDFEGILGLLVGSSVYLGNSGQGAVSPIDGSTIDARTVIWEGHAQYRARGIWLRGLAALADVSDVEEINQAQGFTGNASVGERLIGWYLEGGYDLLRSVRTGQRLLPYVRYEQVNTQDRVPTGFSANPANDQQIVTLGAAWFPIPNIVVKADYQIRKNEADTGVDQFNVNLGYMF